jgi:hypothetical protein
MRDSFTHPRLITELEAMPPTTGRGGWWIGVFVAILSLSSTGWLAAEVHWQRVRSRSQAPCRPYGYDDPSQTVSARTLIAKPAEPVRLGETSRGGAANTRCKRFLLNRETLVNGPAILSDVGLVLYETGESACTAKLSHNGGPNEDLRANRVTVRIRAYGSFRSSPVEGEQNLDGPCLCEWSKSYIVRKDDPIVVQLSGNQVQDKLRRFFGEIVQLELDVTVRNSR